MRMPIQLGRCKYCGKEVAIEAESRYDADQEVTEMCECPGASRHRRFEKAHESLSFIETDLRADGNAGAESIRTMREELTKLEKVLA